MKHGKHPHEPIGVNRHSVANLIIAALLLAIASPGTASAGFLSEWFASSGLYPDQIATPWTLIDDANPENPALSPTLLTLSTSANGEHMLYGQTSSVVDTSAPFFFEARLRFVSGQSSDNSRTPTAFHLVTGPDLGNALFIGQDEIFFNTGNLTKGPSAIVDTDGTNHTYRVEYNGGSLLTAFYDGSPILTGTIFSSNPFNGSPNRIGWGTGGLLAYGVSEWEFVRHNALVAPVGGQTNSWTNIGSGLWQNAPNWSLGVAPASDQSALLITNANTKTVTIDATTASSFPSTMTISNLTVSSAAVGVNTLLLDNAGFATPLHVFNVVTMESNSVIIVNNSALQVGVDLNVGASISDNDNHLIITNGGRVVSGSATIGGLPGSSNTVLVTGAGSLWNNTGNLAVRNSAPGIAITIADGGRFVGANVFLGNSASADDNIVLVTGAGSSWTNTGTLHVGSFHSDTHFIITNGATAHSSTAIVGTPSRTNISALVTGLNSRWSSDGSITVGNDGSGNTLTISDSGSLLATNAGGTALLLVNTGGTLILDNGAIQADNLVVTNGPASVSTSTAARSSLGPPRSTMDRRSWSVMELTRRS